MQQAILITGITGFIGSHLAENLVSSNFQVIGLKRPESNLWRNIEIESKITWIDIDKDGMYLKQLEEFSIDTIIHGAWIGVESEYRDDWNAQYQNIPFLISILNFAKFARVKKFIFLGSQAEYGNIQGEISENHIANALNAYGGIKLACLDIVKTFCACNNINWIWLRLFSVFGEKENKNWMIPSLINAMKTTHAMDCTLGEQKYSYLYIKDFSEIIKKIIQKPIDSGIYNISSNQSIKIKDLMVKIRDQVNPDFKLNFGALNYRKNQSMHIKGCISKLQFQIGEIKFTNFNEALERCIKYYINK